MSIILKLEKVTKKFGGLVANDNIDMDLEKNSILGLIGPNGSGKTTLFNCVNGIYQVDSGNILFENKKINGLSPNKGCGLGITRTFQIPKILNNMSVLDYVVSGAFCRTWNIAEARGNALEVLKFIGFGLYEKRDFLANELTLSEKKSMQIASILATRPKTLMLDEAMSGLTKNEQQDAVRLIKKIRDLGITLLVVEHVMEIIMIIADRIVVLNSGKKIFDDIPKKVANNPEVIKAYLGGK